MKLDETHDPALESWVESANQPACDFPIQNLPFGRFRRTGGTQAWRIGVAIGDQVLDLAIALNAEGWTDLEKVYLVPLAKGDLNAFMLQGAAARQGLRGALSKALAKGSQAEEHLASALVAQSDVELTLPCQIGDYTDFYIGIHHAQRIGAQFRPDNPLLPNYKWVPIGYHGRASSIGVSGDEFPRPRGQTMPAGKNAGDPPEFGPSKRVDYELELGVFVGSANPRGQPLSMNQAEQNWFGMVLFNDWSARDIQPWEYQPLGPFLSKNFCSTISPWIVTQEALAPFRVSFAHPAADPQPLPYLDSEINRLQGSFSIELEAWLQTEKMRAAGEPAARLSSSNFKDAAYWTVAQLLAHHTASGCNLQPGDLLGTGTLSGPEREQAASLIELTTGGKEPIKLRNGETRGFLEDGDTVVLRGRCVAPNARSIGFGECAGTVLAAREVG